jgi:hypothetical protein
MPDEVSLFAVVIEALQYFLLPTTSNATQKYVLGNYTSLVDSKNYFKLSLNVQSNFSVRLDGAKNMVLLCCQRGR